MTSSLLSTENRLTPTSMSLPPPKTASSDPLQDEPTSYNPQHQQTELDSIHHLHTKWTPPDRVKSIMDSAKQKLRPSRSPSPNTRPLQKPLLLSFHHWWKNADTCLSKATNIYLHFSCQSSLFYKTYFQLRR